LLRFSNTTINISEYTPSKGAIPAGTKNLYGASLFRCFNYCFRSADVGTGWKTRISAKGILLHRNCMLLYFKSLDMHDMVFLCGLSDLQKRQAFKKNAGSNAGPDLRKFDVVYPQYL